MMEEILYLNETKDGNGDDDNEDKDPNSSNMLAQTYSSNIWAILACPYCARPTLSRESEDVVCSNCCTAYEMTSEGQLDFRLKEKKRHRMDFELGNPLLNEDELEFKPLSANPSAEVDYSRLTIPRHLTKEILSYFPKAKHNNSLMLDLGCCDTVHREVCEHAGFEYVGLDYNAENAPILGDAHALPFRDDSFEFVLSIAVLQHIRFPFVMAQEVTRVLKPGGKFIGTVAFLEPFHGQCYYHHTHLGVYNTLLSGPLKVQQIAPSKDWNVLAALTGMNFFPQMPILLAKLLIYPLNLLHQIWWRAGAIIHLKPNETRRIRDFTGSFTYIAVKEG